MCAHLQDVWLNLAIQAKRTGSSLAIVVLLVITGCTGAQRQALTDPAEIDTAGPVNDAVVHLGNGCTGVLIADNLVLSSAHCHPNLGGEHPVWDAPPPVWRPMLEARTRSDNCCESGLRGEITVLAETDITGYDLRSVELPANADAAVCRSICEEDDDCQAWTLLLAGNSRPAPRCFIKALAMEVWFGNQRESPAWESSTSEFSQPGFDDIILFRLNEPVPTSIARPVTVLTDLAWPLRDVNLRWLRRQVYAMVGWGGGAEERRRARGLFVDQGIPSANVMTIRPLDGVQLEPGDSGSPVFALTNACTFDGRQAEPLVGILQHLGGGYVTTFGKGTSERRSDLMHKPNLSRWIESAMYESEIQGAELIPLYSWHSPERSDHFLTSDPDWSAHPRTLLMSSQAFRRGSIMFFKEFQGYQRLRMEGLIFHPRRDQPPGTVPLFTWFNPERGDHLTTSNPDWSVELGSIAWGDARLGQNPNRIVDGPVRRGYRLTRLEGFIFDPHEPQPRGTVTLMNWWSNARQDNRSTSHPAMVNDIDILRSRGIFRIREENEPHLRGGRIRDGYQKHRFEGFVLPWPRGDSPEIQSLTLLIETGESNLRSNSIFGVEVTSNGGRVHVSHNLNRNEEWPNHSTRSVSISLPRGLVLTELESITLIQDGAPRNILESFNNWDIDSIMISAQLRDSDCSRVIFSGFGDPFVRMTGRRTRMTIPLTF